MIRRSDLPAGRYLGTFFDTGDEFQRKGGESTWREVAASLPVPDSAGITSPIQYPDDVASIRGSRPNRVEVPGCGSVMKATPRPSEGDACRSERVTA
jgi:hypothetical protein